MTAVPSWLWIFFTVFAAGAQTARNAMQRDLIATLGTARPTFVRSCTDCRSRWRFSGIVCVFQRGRRSRTSRRSPGQRWRGLPDRRDRPDAGGDEAKELRRRHRPPRPSRRWRLSGWRFLGDRVTPRLAIAIVIGDVGVMVMSWPKKTGEATAQLAASDLRARVRRPVRAFGDRLSRRHPGISARRTSCSALEHSGAALAIQSADHRLRAVVRSAGLAAISCAPGGPLLARLHGALARNSGSCLRHRWRRGARWR